MSKIKKVLIIIPIIVGIGILGLFVKHQIDYSKEFSSVEWKQLYSNFNVHLDNDELDAPDAYWDLAERKKMVKSLIKSKKLVEINKNEIIRILGLEGNNLNENSWMYWIGFGDFAEGLFLRINFDEDNRVISVEKYDG